MSCIIGYQQKIFLGSKIWQKNASIQTSFRFLFLIWSILQLWFFVSFWILNFFICLFFFLCCAKWCTTLFPNCISLMHFCFALAIERIVLYVVEKLKLKFAISSFKCTRPLFQNICKDWNKIWFYNDFSTEMSNQNETVEVKQPTCFTVFNFQAI